MYVRRIDQAFSETLGMSAPALTQFVNGQGVTSADMLNTFEQTCGTYAQLASFTGLPGMQVYMRGFTTPADGGQGAFYWNATSTATDDAGVTAISPVGNTAAGRWIRIETLTPATFLSSVVLAAAAVPLTTNVPANVTSISLPAGTWDVSGTVGFSVTGTTVLSGVEVGVSLVSATLQTVPGPDGWAYNSALTPGIAGQSLDIPTGPLRVTVATATLVYLVAQAQFTVSTCAAFGVLTARKVPAYV
jgi:hypothetical protein